MGLRDPPLQDQLGSSYSYHPQHPDAYQSSTTPPQYDAVENSDVFGKASRHTDRHTIVDMSLRSVRFLVLASIGLGAAFAYATATNTRLVLTKVMSETTDMATFHDDVNAELSNYNALFGTIMFICSKVFEVYMETFIFPTLHTYLHNCSLFPGDQPQRVHSKIKGNAIFWSLKTVLIFMNVGFASLYVGQSVVKEESASRRLAASEMMESLAPGGLLSSWGVASFTKTSETDILHTILRTAVTGSTTLFDPSSKVDATSCLSHQSVLSARDVDTASVAFGFPSHDWSAGVLRHGAKPTFSVQFTLHEFEEQQAQLEQQASSGGGSAVLPTAQELLVQGIAVLRSSLNEAAQPVSQQIVKTPSLKSLVDQVVRGMNASLSFDTSKLEIGLAAYELTEDVSLVSMMIGIPLNSRDGAVLCGTSGCVYSHTLDTRLKSEISIMPYTTDPNCLSPSRCNPENTAFLYGLGRSVKDASIRANPQEFLSLSFGKMAWRASPLHVRHQAECVDGHCLGLSVPLSSANGVVLVSSEALPSDHLLASPANPLRLVALNPVAIPAEYGSYTTWDRVANASPESADTECSGISLVDSYLKHVDANKLFIEKPLQAMYTSALLYLLQNGVFIEYADATSRKLALAASAAGEDRVDIEVAIPTTSSLATFAGCGIMVLLTVFVIYFPTDRVKLSPNTTPAAQYVQILTDDLYPDIVHKKRLRFVNGDGLLFNEYVVDSIVLHAKRNEKKKIYL